MALGEERPLIKSAEGALNWAGPQFCAVLIRTVNPALSAGQTLLEGRWEENCREKLERTKNVLVG